MAEGPSDSGRGVRYYCHKCEKQVNGVEDHTCPYCAHGFIEILENDVGVHPGTMAEEELSDTDVSNEDQDGMGDLAEDENSDESDPEDNAPRRRSALVEELYYVIGGDSENASADPYTLLSQQGYNVSGVSLDEIVSQLLSQLESAGPPPLPRAEFDALQCDVVTAERAASNTACTICWELYAEGEIITILPCDHVFHRSCIRPWLLIHATCPICRNSLISEEPYLELMVPSASTPVPRLILRRITRRLGVQQQVVTVEQPVAGCSSYNPALLSGAGDLLPDDEETEESRKVEEPPKAEAAGQAEGLQQDEKPPQTIEPLSAIKPEPEPEPEPAPEVEPEVEPKTASCDTVGEKEPEPNVDLDKE